MKELKLINVADPEKVGVFPKKSSYSLVIVGEQSSVEDLIETIQRINIKQQDEF